MAQPLEARAIPITRTHTETLDGFGSGVKELCGLYVCWDVTLLLYIHDFL